MKNNDMLKTRAMAYVANKIEKNHFNETKFDIIDAGVEVYVKPTGYEDEITSWDEVEFIFINCRDYNIAGRDTLEELTDALLNFDQIINRHEGSRVEIREFYQNKILAKLETGEDASEYDWQMYSDMYKDTYGRRPERISPEEYKTAMESCAKGA